MKHLLIFLGLCAPVFAADSGHSHEMAHDMEDDHSGSFTLHGNFFGVGIAQSGPRGRDRVVAPHMVMANLETPLGESHYFGLGFMGTGEKWTYPKSGYPLLLQVGEDDENDKPYLDAQHPHSSPIMGLTLHYRIRFDEESSLKFFFAPRGESTDGPTAFMHRKTGEVNPDAPLGHHVGQDAGHITSTVIGTNLRIGGTLLEASTFHGEEPEPTHVDLPLGDPNSYALRVSQEVTSQWKFMVSAAHVKKPESHDPGIPFVNRYSASVYTDTPVSDTWRFYNTFIYGMIAGYDRSVLPLKSFGEEFLFHGGTSRVWGRVERLQRTPRQLQINVPGRNSDRGLWVSALTVGYTHRLMEWGNENKTGFFVGASGTKDLLPQEFISAYGGNPWTGKVFIQLSGMGMWGL